MGGTVSTVELAAFDLDGTLLRGDTVCEGLARDLGGLERMRELEDVTTHEELLASREEMARWYEAHSIPTLTESLAELELAPGAHEAFGLCRDHSVTTAIVSLTWEFAVEHFAAELGADHYVGTTLHPDGDITHFLPMDKPVWVRDLADVLGIDMDRVMSVGDTTSDAHMLNETGHAVYLGDRLPDEVDDARHVPDGDLHAIVSNVLGVT